MRSRPVKPRATRMACIVASVPETVIRAMSQKVISQMSSATEISSSLVRLKLTPRRIRSLT